MHAGLFRPWRWTLTAILLVGFASAGAAMLLPDNPYQRWQLLALTSQRRVLWIYQRLHYNPAPIDVAFLGTSRTGAAVNVQRLRADLAAAGRPVNITDLSLPENGRDLHWVIAQQLLAAKPPKLLIIGVIEQPSRFGHPGFKYLAPAADVVDPGYLGNLNYPTNLIYLPYRQMYLAAASVFPGTFGLAPAYDPRHPATDDATMLWKSTKVRTRKWLDDGARVYRRGISPPRFGPRFANEEFGDERAYIGKIVALARQHRVRVAFLFLPYYSGPSLLQERTYYERYGRVLDASFVATHDRWYYNLAHVNDRGSAIITDWLAPRIEALLPAD